MNRVVAVMPAYHCAGRVGEVVRAVRRLGLDVVVVDDGSTDSTGGEAEDAGAVVVRHPVNLGKGEALATGFVLAMEHGATGVLTLDADGQHDPGDIPALLEAHGERPNALVLGVRDPALMPRRSRIGNEQSNFWLHLFMGRRRDGQRLPDTQTGFRIYPTASLLRRVRLRSQRFETETELLLWASKLRVEIVPVPVKTIYDGQTTHFRTATDALRVIALVIGSTLWRVPRD